MKRLISLIIMMSLTCALADLDDNQIEDFELAPQVANRGRLLVKGCKPCKATSECQLMGMQRFSEPRCEPLSGLGAPCRPFQEPENKTLHFPHAILYCDNVHMQFCPCASGLECDLETAECKRPAAAPRGRPQIATHAIQDEQDDLEAFGEHELPLPVAFEPMAEVRRQQNAGGAVARSPWGVARFY